jgi:hypothetical protein
MSSKAIAMQMRDFASNPASHGMLVEDPTMLKTLVSFMDAADSELTILCLETFLEISKPETHRKFLLALPGLLAKLVTYSDRDGSTEEDKKIRNIAKQTFDNLQVFHLKEAHPYASTFLFAHELFVMLVAVFAPSLSPRKKKRRPSSRLARPSPPSR